MGIQRGRFVVRVRHPLVPFLWHLCQPSFKGSNFYFIQQYSFVEEEEDNNKAQDTFALQKSEYEDKPELLKRVEEGLKYYTPELCEEGVNGSYFLRDTEGKIIAIFKPTDEEGDSQNNPKRSEENESFVHRGILPGKQAIREVVAYLLDKEQIPQTMMVTLQHPSFQTKEGASKTGSLQEFVENEGASWDVGPNRFPIDQVHQIGVLDMRIFNNDRHGGNILMRRTPEGELQLVPIDHGLCLSSTLDRAWFEWLHWPQTKEPFNDRVKKFIQEIDVERDAALLRENGFEEEFVRTMILSTTLLKKGSEAGLNLFQIASMVCREELDKPCLLEQMVKESKGMEALFLRMDEEIKKRNRENCESCEIL